MPPKTPPRARAIPPVKKAQFAADFLELFYPVHYKIGMKIEDGMRGGRLSRHQVAVLWLIRTEGDEGTEIRRKDIERAMGSWFEIKSSAISKVIRSLTRPPLDLVEIFEDAESGREKRVRLTAKGHTEIDRIVVAGREFIASMVEHLSVDDAKAGVRFLAKVSQIVEIV